MKKESTDKTQQSYSDSDKSGASPNAIASVGVASSSYFSQSLEELKKVTYPSRQEAMQASIVTLLIIAFLSVALFLMDLVFHSIVSLLVF